MDPEITEDEAFIAATKAELRRMGWFVRYTEWPHGHEVILHDRSDTSRHIVTEWHRTERDAWREALHRALDAAPRAHEAPPQPNPPVL